MHKKKFKIFVKFFSLIFIFNTISFSQNYKISGKVLDIDTEAKLENVNVYIENQENGTITDKDGFFSLSLYEPSEKQVKLIIKLIGYEQKIVSINLSSSNIKIGNILIKNVPIEMQAIEIHSHKNEFKQVSDISMSGSKLDQNLKGTIASTLSNQPNIGINSMGSVTAKPALRGFSGDRFLLTKDGIETGDLSQSSIDHAIALDMNEVNEIEILRGPKSLIFGPNAIGGVVNANSFGNPKVRFDSFFTKFLIGSESFNESKYRNFMFYIPVKNNQLNLFYSSKQTSNETNPLGVLENTKSSTINYKLGITNYSKIGYLNFIVERLNMDYGIPPTETGHIDGVDILLLKDSQQINYHQDISFLGFEQIDLKYNLHDYVHLELVNDEIDYDIFELIDSKTYHISLGKKTKNYKLELSSKKSFIGFEYSNKMFLPDGFYLTPITEESQLSMYGFYQTFLDKYNIDFMSSFRFGDLDVIPGDYVFISGNRNLFQKNQDGDLVLDDNGDPISLVKDRKFQNISISFGIKKNIGKFQFDSWFMHTMRPPRVEELYSDGPHLAAYSFEIGNPNLNSERIYGIENSIGYKSNFFDFSLVTFYNYSPYYFQMSKDGHCEIPSDWQPWTSHPCYGVDWIDWGSGGLGWLHKYSAKGYEVTIKGIELDLGYEINNFKVGYNFSLVNGINETLGGNPLSYMNPTKQILDFDYTTQFISHKIRMSKINPQNRLGEFETYTPGAFLVDYVITFNYKMNKLTIQANNLFDEVHYNHLSRIKNIAPESGKNIHIVYKIMMDT